MAGSIRGGQGEAELPRQYAAEQYHQDSTCVLSQIEFSFVGKAQSSCSSALLCALEQGGPR